MLNTCIQHLRKYNFNIIQYFYYRVHVFTRLYITYIIPVYSIMHPLYHHLLLIIVNRTLTISYIITSLQYLQIFLSLIHFNPYRYSLSFIQYSWIHFNPTEDLPSHLLTTITIQYSFSQLLLNHLRPSQDIIYLYRYKCSI